MKIGFIGAGDIAVALAGQFLKAGHEVVVSNSRGPESLGETVRELGSKASAGTRAEAAQAQMLVLSVPWQHLAAATADLPPLSGRIVIDTMNPVAQPGFRLAELRGLASSEVVAQHASAVLASSRSPTRCRPRCSAPIHVRLAGVACCSCRPTMRRPRRRSRRCSKRWASLSSTSAVFPQAAVCSSSREGRCRR